jgi:hypothetical protein
MWRISPENTKYHTERLDVRKEESQNSDLKNQTSLKTQKGRVLGLLVRQPSTS